MKELKIETYSLFEFCQQAQDLIQQGYVFDFDSNENFPTAYGSMLIAGFKLKQLDSPADEVTYTAEVKVIKSDNSIEIKPELVQKQANKPGRKPKG